jgi:ribosome-associated protein
VKKPKPRKKPDQHPKHKRPAVSAKRPATRKEGGTAKKPRRAGSTELPAQRPADQRGRREALALAKALLAAALDKKATEPVLIDVCGRASYADFIAVVSGRSDRQVEAIAEGVCEAGTVRGRRPLGQEGARNGRWVLIDFGDVVLHVFYHPLREVFDIESLWIDAPRVKLQVPAEARAGVAPGRDLVS